MLDLCICSIINLSFLKCIRTANCWMCSSRQKYGEKKRNIWKNGLELSGARQVAPVYCNLFFQKRERDREATNNWEASEHHHHYHIIISRPVVMNAIFPLNQRNIHLERNYAVRLQGNATRYGSELVGRFFATQCYTCTI